MGIPIPGSCQGPFPAGLCLELRGLGHQQRSIRRCFIQEMIVTLALWGERRGTLITMMSRCNQTRTRAVFKESAQLSRVPPGL